MLWPWKMPLVASPHAFLGARECRLETSVPKVNILKPKQEVRGKAGLGAGGCAKGKARSCSPKVSLSLSLACARARALSLSRPQATRTLSLVAS